MDVKGLAWIGNVYDKFEAMCLEMEEVMYEDTVKFVENQVQTVGANVKRFYSEVMEDLRADSFADPVKVAAADLSLNPCARPEMKLKASAKKEARETELKLTDDSEVISGKSETGVYRRPTASRKGNSKANFLPLAPVSRPITPFSENLRNVSSVSQMKRTREEATDRLDVILPSAGLQGGSRNANEKNCKAMVDTGLPKSHASVNPSATKAIVSAESTGQKQADSASGGLSSEFSAAGTSTNSGVVSQTEQNITTETGNKKSVEEEIIVAHQERLENRSADAAKNDDVLDPDVEIVEPFNESILEETCVLVEEDKLHFVPQGKGSHKSYKKKIREAFSSKMRLTRKEYEQLAAKYTEQNSNQESADRMVSDHPADSTMKILPAQSSESEWELL
ncbi:hypothetical protein ACH5RR_028624 [Cinchona calisaya]|uniref:Uncharacterized protein n=1 Tax=Cinchona calisaya TaxID=153742 RepID=A0ABD2YUK9_9GENT